MTCGSVCEIYVLTGHKCRVKGHLCLLLHRLLPLLNECKCVYSFFFFFNMTMCMRSSLVKYLTVNNVSKYLMKDSMFHQGNKQVKISSLLFPMVWGNEIRIYWILLSFVQDRSPVCSFNQIDWCFAIYPAVCRLQHLVLDLPCWILRPKQLRNKIIFYFLQMDAELTDHSEQKGRQVVKQ